MNKTKMPHVHAVNIMVNSGNTAYGIESIMGLVLVLMQQMVITALKIKMIWNAQDMWKFLQSCKQFISQTCEIYQALPLLLGF